MDRYIKLNIPIDDRAPEGHFLILAYSNGKDVIVPIEPCSLENENLHNCDWEGCGTLSHVFRFSPEMKYLKIG